MDDLLKIINYVKKFYPAITSINENGFFRKKYIYFYKSKSIYGGGSSYDLKMLASSSKRHILEKTPMLIEAVFIDDDCPVFEEVQTFLFSYAEKYSIGGIARSNIARGEYESIDAYKATFGSEFVKEISDLSIWYWGVLNHRIPLITITEENQKIFDEDELWLISNSILSTHFQYLTKNFTKQQIEMGKLIDGGLLSRFPKSGLNIVNTPFDFSHEINKSWKYGLSKLRKDSLSEEVEKAASDISSYTFNICQRIYDGRN